MPGVMHIPVISTQEDEAGKLWVQGQPRNQSKLKAVLDYIDLVPSPSKTTKDTQKNLTKQQYKKNHTSKIL